MSGRPVSRSQNRTVDRCVASPSASRFLDRRGSAARRADSAAAKIASASCSTRPPGRRRVAILRRAAPPARAGGAVTALTLDDPRSSPAGMARILQRRCESRAGGWTRPRSRHPARQAALRCGSCSHARDPWRPPVPRGTARNRRTAARPASRHAHPPINPGSGCIPLLT